MELLVAFSAVQSESGFSAKPRWAEVCRRMTAVGINRPRDHCSDKFRNMRKVYIRTQANPQFVHRYSEKSWQLFLKIMMKTECKMINKHEF
jgi:Myb/SANT-like DNA-binding domain